MVEASYFMMFMTVEISMRLKVTWQGKGGSDVPALTIILKPLQNYKNFCTQRGVVLLSDMFLQE